MRKCINSVHEGCARRQDQDCETELQTKKGTDAELRTCREPRLAHALQSFTHDIPVAECGPRFFHTWNCREERGLTVSFASTLSPCPVWSAHCMRVIATVWALPNRLAHTAGTFLIRSCREFSHLSPKEPRVTTCAIHRRESVCRPPCVLHPYLGELWPLFVHQLVLQHLTQWQIGIMYPTLLPIRMLESEYVDGLQHLNTLLCQPLIDALSLSDQKIFFTHSINSELSQIIQVLGLFVWLRTRRDRLQNLQSRTHPFLGQLKKYPSVG